MQFTYSLISETQNFIRSGMDQLFQSTPLRFAIVAAGLAIAVMAAYAATPPTTDSKKKIYTFETTSLNNFLTIKQTMKDWSRKFQSFSNHNNPAAAKTALEAAEICDHIASNPNPIEHSVAAVDSKGSLLAYAQYRETPWNIAGTWLITNPKNHILSPEKGEKIRGAAQALFLHIISKAENPNKPVYFLSATQAESFYNKMGCKKTGIQQEGLSEYSGTASDIGNSIQQKYKANHEILDKERPILQAFQMRSNL